MASITIRNLNDETKNWLRVRAARNGRSMEEEARLLFDRWQMNDREPDKSGAASELPVQSSVPASSSTNRPSPTRVEHHSPVSNPAGDNGILEEKSILLIITGGIAAYKSLDLIRRLRERGAVIRTIMTRASGEFVTPLSIGALTAGKVYSDIFSHQDEHDIGHIRLSREADIVVVAPATANSMAKMANGLADELASAVLLANNRPVLIAPAMNPLMWQNLATRRNVKTLKQDGVHFIGPNSGEMAESGEAGKGRMAEPLEIVGAIEALLDDRARPLEGMRAIVTSGPTREAIDPVRYLSNHSSGKQGHAIAAALAGAGADVILVSGPVNIAAPLGVATVQVESAMDMKNAVEKALPADIAIFVAAVADWRPVASADEKIKKTKKAAPLAMKLVENPDILKGVGKRKKGRPALVIGFAAETEEILKHGEIKLKKKGADWILANDVSSATGVMGGDENTIRLISKTGVEDWPTMNKKRVAVRLVDKIAEFFDGQIIEV